MYSVSFIFSLSSPNFPSCRIHQLNFVRVVLTFGTDTARISHGTVKEGRAESSEKCR